MQGEQRAIVQQNILEALKGSPLPYLCTKAPTHCMTGTVCVFRRIFQFSMGVFFVSRELRR